MGRSGVAFVSMMAATVSAAALGYSVFWSFQDEFVPRRAAATPQPPAVVQAPAAAPPATVVPAPAREAPVAPPLVAPPPMADVPVIPRNEPNSANSAASEPTAEPEPPPFTPPVKSALAKPPEPAPEVKSPLPETAATPLAPLPPEPVQPRVSASGSAGTGPGAEPALTPPEKPRSPEPAAKAVERPPAREPARADAPAALHSTEPARETSAAAPAALAPAAKAEPAAAPPGPFAALPSAPEHPTVDEPPAEAPRADRPPPRAMRPRRMIRHHAPYARTASLPPFVPPARPAVREAHPITILRGGAFVRIPQSGTESVAAALAPLPPGGIRVMRGSHPRPIVGLGLGQPPGQSFGPPGPLILRVQN
ncbi:MAG: hypothetical protein JO000_25340 [Alphaproteobacteria bacterium]|nr:hypothetical protein [Alphaproteobacteria bacterium]